MEKITVIRTPIFFSEIIHILINLLDPNENFLNSLEKELDLFLWDGKRIFFLDLWYVKNIARVA